MSGTRPTITSRLANLATTPVRVGGPTIATAAVQTLAVGAIVGGGGYLAIGSAADLYNSRSGRAGQFQQQLQFPEDLVQSTRDFFMAFNFVKYQKRSIQSSPFLRSEGTVRLPMPDNLRDNTTVSYNNAALGAAVGAVLDSVAATPIAGASIADTTTNLAGAARGGVAAGLAGGFTQLVANTVPQAAQAAASNYFGLAVNPYQTVLFEKPEFKTHNFSWKIMPKNERESNLARNIYRTLQYHMSPGVSGQITAGGGSGLFFSYPSMVLVSLYPRSDFLYRFKPCVIRSVNVNYAAGSNPSFFKRTDAPTAMTLSIQLQEIEYWTDRDFTASAFSDTFAESEFNNLEARNNPAQTPNTPLAPGIG